jgi:hypothetical protein
MHGGPPAIPSTSMAAGSSEPRRTGTP